MRADGGSHQWFWSALIEEVFRHKGSGCSCVTKGTVGTAGKA